ncbi:MAG: histidine ammonia-lyase [Bacilli bacterium]|nr:histidine ammonia-lyase [Bacilli bacterium]
MAVILTGNDLDLKNFIAVARYCEKVSLSDEATHRVETARQHVKKIIASGKTVYGINTGFGKLSNVAISYDKLEELQENLLKSHACGVGEPLSAEAVRGAILLRVNALAKGYSGIRLCVIKQLIDYLNYDITPVVPSKGSLGASGDLAPLAHMALTLLGEGEVYFQNSRVRTKEALAAVGLKPLYGLEAKEGLSLINGTQIMTSVGALAIYDALNLIKAADVAGALSLEALLGIKDAFDSEVHSVRPHAGQIATARNIRRLTEGSEYLSAPGEFRVQDGYSLRCLAQVHGASRDALAYIRQTVETEFNAATDNPLIFSEDTVISGGNFHGQPLALAFDFLKIATAELANISERRLERLVNPFLNEGLPAFLVARPGLNSGFMIVQYSAASLVSENKGLAHPASVDSIPSSAGQEDHVSMGTIAARGAAAIVENSINVIAMELFAALQALDFRAPKKRGAGTEVAYQYLRKQVPFIKNDEIMHPYIERINQVIKSGELVQFVEKIIGELE